MYILKARYYRINFFYYFYKETSRFGVWIFLDVNIFATGYINVIHSKIMLKWYIPVSCMVDNSIYMYSDKGFNFNGLWISMKSNKIWAQFIINSINFIYLVLCETQCSSSCHWTIMSCDGHWYFCYSFDVMIACWSYVFYNYFIRSSSRCSVIWKIQEISLNLKWNLVLNPVLFYNIEDLWSFEVLSIYLLKEKYLDIVLKSLVMLSTSFPYSQYKEDR